MTAYYNENDAFAAQWLRNLIDAGHIAPGVVDERSIADVAPTDVAGFTQVHLFAGIGGWSLAARLAGWPDSRRIWTGSCPCQPYSAAGKRKGAEDARNLWPEMRRLVRACRPDVVVGEQVASKDSRIWLAGVRTDLEDVAYDFWSADSCAASVGAPHIRQRLWWLADTLPTGRRGGTGWLADTDQRQRRRLTDSQGRERDGASAGWQQGDSEPERSGAVVGLGDASGTRGGRDTRAVPGAQGEGERQRLQPRSVADKPVDASAVVGLGDAAESGWPRCDGAGESEQGSRPGRSLGFWSDYAVVHCTDGKARRFESGSFPLAYGVPGRVGRLRAYGNAINPYVAAEVLAAYLDGPV